MYYVTFLVFNFLWNYSARLLLSFSYFIHFLTWLNPIFDLTFFFSLVAITCNSSREKFVLLCIYFVYLVWHNFPLLFHETCLVLWQHWLISFVFGINIFVRFSITAKIVGLCVKQHVRSVKVTRLFSIHFTSIIYMFFEKWKVTLSNTQLFFALTFLSFLMYYQNLYKKYCQLLLKVCYHNCSFPC